MNKREALVNKAVDAVLAEISRESQRAAARWEYLDDPDELVARRGFVTARRVA